MTPDIRMIPIDGIDSAEEWRLRSVDEKAAARICISMRDRGQLTPIEVREVQENEFRLISGAHRLHAAKLLGWDTILASIFSGSETEAQLREIDENLHRAELSPYDEATFLERRRQLWVALHGAPQHGGDRRSSKWKAANLQLANLQEEARAPDFYPATAAALGVSEDTVRRAVRRRLKIGAHWDEVGQVRDVVKGVHLDQLAKLSARYLPRAVELLISGLPVAEAIDRAKPPRKGRSEDPKAFPNLKAVKRAWAKADNMERLAIVAFIEAEAKKKGGK